MNTVPRLVPLDEALAAEDAARAVGMLDPSILEEPDDLPPPLGDRLARGMRISSSGRRAQKPQAPVVFKSAATFCGEYVPLNYTIEGIMRSASLYALTARTGAGKTALNVVAALAVATGRQDILNREVATGRVAYLACENPDDIRMRIKIAAFIFNISLEELSDRIIILERCEKPEAVLVELQRLSEQEPFALVIVDTLAAFFDGDNINDAVQGGQFMRRLRPLTQIAGLPSVIVAAHPVKNASEEALVPYGSGAILNEVDGNLTLWKKPDTGIVSLHWQGKLRGLEFQPVPFRFEVTGCPDILDAKGREVHLPTLRPSSEEAAEDRQQAEVDTDRALLLAMLANQNGTQRAWGDAIGRTASVVNGKLQTLDTIGWPFLQTRPPISISSQFRGHENLPSLPVQASRAPRLLTAPCMSVSERSVRSAVEVRDHAVPELQAKVERGEVSVSAAADVAKLPESDQREIVARGEKEILEAAKQIRAARHRNPHGAH